MHNFRYSSSGRYAPQRKDLGARQLPSPRRWMIDKVVQQHACVASVKDIRRHPFPQWRLGGRLLEHVLEPVGVTKAVRIALGRSMLTHLTDDSILLLYQEETEFLLRNAQEEMQPGDGNDRLPKD